MGSTGASIQMNPQGTQRAALKRTRENKNMTTKLNLGCGEFKKTGYVNVDYFSVSEPDVRHNLNQFPYPFDSDQFALIEANHLLEHLEDPFSVMKELYRIAHHDALIRIRVPHFSRGFTHAQHTRGFDVSFPLYFNPSFQGGYQGFTLDLIKARLRWFAQPYLKRTAMPMPVFLVGSALGFALDCVANLSPFLCSRLWCFWVGGFEEIEFEFKVNKGRTD
jgi:SAM-dependent methyltransferase